jgi:hypothetical protein
MMNTRLRGFSANCSASRPMRVPGAVPRAARGDDDVLERADLRRTVLETSEVLDAQIHDRPSILVGYTSTLT